MTHCKFDLAMQLPLSECVRLFDEQEINLEWTPQAPSKALSPFLEAICITLSSLLHSGHNPGTFKSLIA